MSDKNTVQILLTAIDKSLSKVVNVGKKSLGGLGKEADAVNKKISDGGKKSSKDLNAAFKAIDIRPFKEIDREIKKVEASYKRLAKSGKLSNKELKIAQSKTKEQVAKLNNELKGLDTTTKKVDGKIKKFGKSLFKVGTAATVAIGAVATLVITSARAAKEIGKLARMAGTSSEEFRAFAYATESVGISGEKLADISKDIQDRVGDFIATGGGEFADFFENVGIKVGLTAEALQGLSGPDALIAVQKAMDDANVSAEEQVFYMEALANDASLLIPLLKNEGKAFKDLAKEASESGYALSNIDNASLIKAEKATKKAVSAFGALKDSVAAEFAPLFADAMTSSAKLMVDFIGTARKMAGVLVNIGESLKGWKAVASGKLGFFEFATMNAEEFDEWLEKNTESVKNLGGEASDTYRDIALKAKAAADAQQQHTTKALDAMRKEYEKYVNEVSRLQDEITNRTRSAAEQLREMGRTGMSEVDAWRDLREEAQEYEQAAEDAVGAGDFDKAVVYADKARDAYAKLNTEVEDSDLSQSDILEVAKSGVERAAELAVKALESQKEAAQAAADTIDDKADGKFSEFAEYMADTTEATERLGVSVDDLWKKWLATWLNNKNEGHKVLDGFQAKIDKMDGQEVVLKIKNETSVPGGEVPGFSKGTILPGYGGGDKHHARLESGEGVLRKEAVRKFGRSNIRDMNNLKVPSFNMRGPIGNMENVGSGGGDTVTIHLHDDTGDKATVIAQTKNDYMAFERIHRKKMRLSSS